MRRVIIAAAALAALTTAALADFVTFDKAKFDAQVNSKTVVVLHTHESWCPVCRVQANALTKLQKDPKFSKVVMFRANPGADRAALEPLKAATRSLIVVYAGGKESGRLNSDTDDASIRMVIEMAAGE